MFVGCTNLQTAPELPFTELTENCFYAMFKNCTSLTSVPDLQATSLAENYCTEMFMGCTSLLSAPNLPATTLSSYCYDSMFRDCTSLTSFNYLPATRIAAHAYDYMFYNCTSLKLSAYPDQDYQIPVLPIDVNNYSQSTKVFEGTTGTSTSPWSNYHMYLYGRYSQQNNFYVEALTAGNISLNKVNDPNVGKAYYGIDENPETLYTYGTDIFK